MPGMPPEPSPSKFKWSGGAAYEGYIGRWSRLVATEFIPWLSVPAGATWIDVGCGTGELTRTILGSAAPRRVVSLDPSEGYLEHARAATKDLRVEFRRGTDQDVRSQKSLGGLPGAPWQPTQSSWASC